MLWSCEASKKVEILVAISAAREEKWQGNHIGNVQGKENTEYCHEDVIWALCDPAT